MKQGWEIKKIKDICNKASSNIAQNKIVELDGDYPVFGASGFVQNIDFYHRDKRYIGVVKDGSGVGRVNIYPPYSSLLGTLQYILPNNGYDLDFVAYALKRVNLPKFSSGAAIPHIYFRDYGEVEIAVPSLDEQKRIVDILDKEFEKIDTLKANAEKGLQYAKNLFQSALKQELLPKEGWMIKSLDMISTFSQGVQVEVGKQFTEKLDGYMRFLRIVDFTQGNEPPRYVDIIDERYQVKKDSLSVVRYGASAGFICTGQEGVIANNIFKIEPKRDTLISNAYLYYVLISDIFQSVIRKNVNGAAMPAISFGMIKDVNIPYPSIQEQNQIVAHLDKLKAHCNNLQKNYEKTIALCDDMKQALLRKAFNGELKKNIL